MVLFFDRASKQYLTCTCSIADYRNDNNITWLRVGQSKGKGFVLDTIAACMDATALALLDEPLTQKSTKTR
jgi:hypothetical protein